MNFPTNLQYSSDHEWIQIEGDTALVGISDFAQGELGDIVYIDISITGNELKKGEIFGSVEAVKTVSDLFMPITGTITEINPELVKTPELVNSDPYQKGWMVKIKISDHNSSKDLMNVDEYKKQIGV